MKSTIGICVAAAVLAVVGIAYLCGDGEAARRPEPARVRDRVARQEGRGHVARAVAEAPGKGTAGGRAAKRAKTAAGYRPAEARISEALQAALDAEDRPRVFAQAAEALKSSDPELRREALEALGWYGAEALPELMASMADADEDVAQTAVDKWTLALGQLETAESRVQSAYMALRVLTNADALDRIGPEFTSAANDLIDGEEDEEKASRKRIEVVQGLLDLIEGGVATQAASARELYQDITGNPWMGVEEAEKYLRDPDAYVAPDAESVGG